MSSYQLRHLDSSKIIRLKHAITTIGRQQESCDIVLQDSSVSRRHCLLSLRAHELLLSDLGSRNGTLVNHAKVQQATLHVGDEITVGSEQFIVEFWVRKRATDADLDLEIVRENHAAETPATPQPEHSQAAMMELESERWFVRFLDMDLGPFALPEIAMRYRRGEFQLTDLMRRTDDTDWRLLSDVLPNDNPNSLGHTLPQEDNSLCHDGHAPQPAFEPRGSECQQSLSMIPISPTARPQFVVHSERRRLPANPPVRVLVDAGCRVAIEWLRPYRKWAQRSALVGLALIVAMFVLSYPSDSSNRRTFENLFAELQTKRSTLTPQPAWANFESRATEQVGEIVTRLQATASSKSPARRALLFAGRDYLAVMVRDGEHRNSVLSPIAEDRERRFRRCLNTAVGIAQADSLESTPVPAPNAPVMEVATAVSHSTSSSQTTAVASPSGNIRWQLAAHRP